MILGKLLLIRCYQATLYFHDVVVFATEGRERSFQRGSHLHGEFPQLRLQRHSDIASVCPKLNCTGAVYPPLLILSSTFCSLLFEKSKNAEHYKEIFEHYKSDVTR